MVCAAEGECKNPEVFVKMNKRYILLVIGAVLAVGVIVWNTLGAQPESEQTVLEDKTGATTPMETKTKQYTSPPAMSLDANKTYTATLTTDKGVMRVGLFAKEAPITVNNFVFLAREGFYNDTVFHRVIRGFMIQGGDPQGSGRGGPGYRFDDEPVTREYVRGTIAMANSGPDTNGSQFFIMHADYGLPKNYVIFGAINPSDAESLATLDAIAAEPMMPGGEGSQPVAPVRVTSVTIKEQ